jgi:hypothetical protein
MSKFPGLAQEHAVADGALGPEEIDEGEARAGQNNSQVLASR